MKIEKSTQYVGKWIAEAKIDGKWFRGYGEKFKAIDDCFELIKWHFNLK